MSGFGHRFLPTQAEVHPRLQAPARAPLPGPGPAPESLARASQMLRGLFRTSDPVLILPGPGELLREIGLRAAVEHRALALVGGPAGESLAAQAESLGKEVIRVMTHPGRAVEPEQLARFLQGPEVDSVVMVHAELNGALAPLEELSRLIRQRPELLLFVDASLTIGADPVETGGWGLDFVVAASEGPIALPPGLAFAALSPRLLARARGLPGRGHHLDLLEHHRAAELGRSLLPTASGLAALLEQQLAQILEVEGLPARWQRHQAMRQLVAEWASSRADVELLARPPRAAGALSVLRLTDGLDGGQVVQALAGDGWHIGVARDAGGRDCLLIGHMGEQSPAGLAELLAALGRRLERTGPLNPP
jgi:aspartate aminotransferase-like enzyme